MIFEIMEFYSQLLYSLAAWELFVCVQFGYLDVIVRV
jgi:hypothetical protein